MALVAAYGGDSSDEEFVEEENVKVSVPLIQSEYKKEEGLGVHSVQPQESKENLFSDDEDEDSFLSSSKNGFPGVFTSSLPKPVEHQSSGFIDDKEDVSDIIQGKTYGDEHSNPLPPPSQPFSKKTKVQIKLPTLKSLFKDLETTKQENVSSTPNLSNKSSATKSISSFLPLPKHTLPTLPVSSFVKKSGSTPKSVIPFTPRSITKKPPRQESRPPPSKKKKIDSSDDEEEDGQSFFTFEDANDVPTQQILPTLPLPVLNPSKEIPIEMEPIVGPSKPDTLPSQPQYSSSSSVDLMSDEAALERLGGKHSLRNKEHITNVVEINGEDNRPDPKIWLTKAVTEDELNKPGPRVTIKGVQKSRHQITYLAQLAKANEFKLQQEWANNAHSRRQSAQKYGF